ncbi:hypothetical protein [Sporomusa aerivorans]|uniref:hypothetical protein n=1 Tax=Sporomusa aerivorans TaxID=204936 RepID=UPI00352A01DD
MDWTTQYCNDPTHDFDLVIEILYKDENVAMIRYRDELELIWFANNGIVYEGKKRLNTGKH